MNVFSKSIYIALLCFALLNYQSRSTKLDNEVVDSDFILYSSLIQKGESALLNNKIDSSKVYYGRAIDLIDSPLAKDCFTGMQISASVNDKEGFKRFMDKGFMNGLTPELILNDSLLNKYIANNSLRKKLIKRFKKKNVAYLKSINTFLKDTINKISSYDNRWKIYYMDSLSAVDKINSEKYSSKYDSIVTELVEKKLMPLVVKYGFPGERLIGIEKSGNPSDPYNYNIGNNHALFILLHYYSFDRDCKFNTILHDQLLLGNMTPQQYASVMDFQAKYTIGDNCSEGYFNQWWSSDNSKDFESINKRRKNIGLCPFEEETKKLNRGRNICYQYDDGIYEHIKLFYWCG